MLEDAVWDLMWSLKYNPINLGQNSSFVVSYFAFKSLILESLPATVLWPITASVVDRILQGDRSDDLLNLLATIYPIDSDSVAAEALVVAANAGIQCSDRSPYVRIDNLTELMPKLDQMHSISRFMSDVLDPTTFTCNRWKFVAKERYEGDWQRIQTRNPILFISNTYDPRTPLKSAFNVSASFPGSVVLEVNGYGHCSLNLESSCTDATIAAYFVDGTLPGQGAVCQVDIQPYESLPGTGY